MNHKLFSRFGLRQGKLFSWLLQPLFTTALLLNTINASGTENIASPIHRVVAGDTLYNLSHQYLNDAKRWREFLRDNEIKGPRHLVIGSDLLIPRDPPTVTVIFTHGEVIQVSDGTSSAQAIAVGDKLFEGAKVFVGSDSYLSLQFADQSIVRVLSDSVLRLKKVREADTSDTSSSNTAYSKKISRILELEHGNLDVSVTPSKRACASKKPKPNTFEIITPMAVAAVRGTRFDVSASDTGTTSGVTQGSVEIRKNSQSNPQMNHATINHALLDTGTGISVNRDGKLGSVHPLLLAPDLSEIPATLNDANYIALNWPMLPNAASYDIRIAADTEMHQVVKNLKTSSPDVRFANLADGEYTLAVRPVDAEGIIGYQATKTLSIHATPAFPFYLEPAYNQTVGKTVKLACTSLSEASAYHLQISRDQDFASTVIDADQLSTCNYLTDKLENGRYFWRVASISKTAESEFKEGPYSKPSQFEVDETLIATQAGNLVSAYWIDKAGLTFNAQISTDEHFSNIVQQKVLNQPSITLDKLPAGIYYMRQQAQDAEGFSGEFSAARKIEIEDIDYSIERTWADKRKESSPSNQGQ